MRVDITDNPDVYVLKTEDKDEFKLINQAIYVAIVHTSSGLSKAVVDRDFENVDMFGKHLNQYIQILHAMDVEKTDDQNVSE